MLYYVYFADAGVPKTGLTLTWEYLLTAENGTDKSGSGPAFTEVGGGWYSYDVEFGASPWNTTGEDLLGVIDGGTDLANDERYKPIALTKRGLALARLSHKAVQDKDSGDIDIYKTDGSSKDFRQDFTDGSSDITRDLAVKS